MNGKAVCVLVLFGILSIVSLSHGRLPRCGGVKIRTKCLSLGYKFNRCRHYNGTIVWARVLRERSRGRCDRKAAWGYDERSVWVDKGCRAVFILCVDLQLELSPPYDVQPTCPPVKQPCCEPGELMINLVPISPAVQDDIHGVYVQNLSPFVLSKSCTRQALVIADFERITRDPSCYGCLEGPYCGRRMLKIELGLDYARSGFMFNVGDSQGNVGGGDDGGIQQGDAEFYCDYPHITVYASEHCHNYGLIQINNGCGPGVHTITLYISNEHVRILNNQGLDYRLCHRCVFALNGQPDTGGVNERVYIGLNRVVNLNDDSTRTGKGVCTARFSWTCPWC